MARCHFYNEPDLFAYRTKRKSQRRCPGWLRSAIYINNAVVGIYKIWNGDTTLVQRKTEAPYSFSNLEIGATYDIRVKSTSIEADHIGLLDLSALRNTILGLDPFYAAKIYTGDVNNSGGVSTLDLVQMLRASVGLYTDIPNDWFSGRKQSLCHRIT